jgi:hypothetical protein
MAVRTQVTLDPELQRMARQKAAALGISFAEYVRGLVAKDLAAPGVAEPPDVSQVFALGDSGGADVAREKDRMVGAAVAAENRR